jgi:hypothetical protein
MTDSPLPPILLPEQLCRLRPFFHQPEEARVYINTCSATVTRSSRWISTAPHCVDREELSKTRQGKIDPSVIQFEVSCWPYGQIAPRFFTIRPEQIQQNPELPLSSQGDRLIERGITLIDLGESSGIQPMREVASRAELAQLVENNANCGIFGFGMRAYQHPYTDPIYLQGGLIDPSEIRLSAEQISLTRTRGAALGLPGDSGGALLCMDQEGHWQQAGVVSAVRSPHLNGLSFLFPVHLPEENFFIPLYSQQNFLQTITNSSQSAARDLNEEISLRLNRWETICRNSSVCARGDGSNLVDLLQFFSAALRELPAVTNSLALAEYDRALAAHLRQCGLDGESRFPHLQSGNVSLRRLALFHDISYLCRLNSPEGRARCEAAASVLLEVLADPTFASKLDGYFIEFENSFSPLSSQGENQPRAQLSIQIGASAAQIREFINLREEFQMLRQANPWLRSDCRNMEAQACVESFRTYANSDEIKYFDLQRFIILSDDPRNSLIASGSLRIGHNHSLEENLRFMRLAKNIRERYDLKIEAISCETTISEDCNTQLQRILDLLGPPRPSDSLRWRQLRIGWPEKFQRTIDRGQDPSLWIHSSMSDAEIRAALQLGPENP